MPCQLENPIKGLRGDKGVAERNRRETYFSDDGSLICPPGKSIIFLQGNKEELVDRPGVSRARVLQVVVGQIG